MPLPPRRPDPALLADMAMFAGLEAAALDRVMDAAQARPLTKGEVVFRQGDPATTCHALLGGRIKIVATNAEGQQVVVQFVGPGEMFGTLAMFLHGYPGDAVVVADGVQLLWSATDMRQMMLDHPVIALNTLGMLGARLEDLQNRMRQLSTERVERRVAQALVRLADQAGRADGTGIAIDFPLSRQDLAEMTGTTLHTVSRILSGWEEAGIIGGGRQKVVVLNLDQLVRVAWDTPPAGRRPPQA